MDQKILVPLDGSREAEVILPCVVRLARKLEEKVILLSVIVPPDLKNQAPPKTRYGPFPDTADRLDVRLQCYLRVVAMYLDIRGVEAEPVVVVGNPLKEVPAQAREHGCNLIAMAGEGDSTLGRRMLIHSVVDDIAEASGASVLAVSPEHMDNCEQVGMELVLGPSG